MHDKRWHLSARGQQIMNNAYDNTITRDYDLHLARQTVHDASEIRKDRVAAAKRALRNGTLMLDAGILATQLLTDPHHGIDLNS
jgi:anti-sigma28 factor (negative regulator of flagellin synthesis)